MDLDVMGIAETWLLPGEKIDVAGYKWIGISREGNAGRGGVGLCVRDEYAGSHSDWGSLLRKRVLTDGGNGGYVGETSEE